MKLDKILNTFKLTSIVLGGSSKDAVVENPSRNSLLELDPKSGGAVDPRPPKSSFMLL